MKAFYILLVVSLVLTITLAYLSILVGSIVLFAISLLSIKVLITTLLFSLFEKKSKIIA
jgi:hypothetical protein